MALFAPADALPRRPHLHAVEDTTAPIHSTPAPWGSTARVVLERDARLSRSVIWDVNRRFFDSHGVGAWSAGHVPSYVTTNACIAGAYAELTRAFCGDTATGRHVDAGSPLAPLTVLELGSGTGRFGYLFMTALRQLARDHGEPARRVRYVMTDFTPTNVDAWMRHPRLVPLLEAGALDLAVFDAGVPGRLELRWSGDVIDRFPGPLVVVANYVFDSLPADCFSIRSGELSEKLVSTTAPGERGPCDDIAQVELTYRRNDVSADGYYGDAALDALLGRYSSELPDGDVLFPVAAMRCMRSLADSADGPTLVLVADKGHVSTREVSGLSEPQLARHGGAFSLMVNFDALARYVQSDGGVALRPACQAEHLQVAAFGLGEPACGWSNTVGAYEAHVARFGPDDFFSVKQAIDRHMDDADIATILAFLHLSGGDRDCFLASYPRLLDLAEHADESQRRRLLRAAAQVWEHEYPIGDTSDLPFCLGVLLLRLRYFPEAARYFEASLDLHGPDARTYLQLAICHYSLHELESALELVDAALRLDPNEPTARSMFVTIRPEIADRRIPDPDPDTVRARRLP
jgi:tetratricopeptide (TPR) repeat protein